MVMQRIANPSSPEKDAQVRVLYAPPIKPHGACPCGVLLCGKSGRARTVRRAKEKLSLNDSFFLQAQRKLN